MAATRRRPLDTTTTEVVRASLGGRTMSPIGTAFLALLLLSLFLCMAILVVLIAEVVRDGIGVFVDRGPDFLTSGLSPQAERAGVWQGIVGSLLIMGFVVVLAFPIGIAAAIWLEEYAADTRFTRLVNVNIRNLAGVPSVVYGLLGLAIFVKTLGDLTGGRSVMAAGITIAILVLPIVIITAAEAIRAVPGTIREAGYGIGATKWEVTRHHVLPAAAPGILTGTVLSLARALGEAAPLILVGAITGFFAVGEQGFAERLQGPFTALPMIVYGWARQPNPEFRELTSAAIIVLLLVLLTANAAAILLRNRYERNR
jgi:phosphate transport system permease protein